MKARALGFPTAGMMVTASYGDRQVAQQWGIPPPDLKRYPAEDVERERIFLRLEAEAEAIAQARRR